MVTPYKIEQGFFAGCTVYEDDELPLDTVEWHFCEGPSSRLWHSLDGKAGWRGNVRTGEMWVLVNQKSPASKQ